MPYFLCGRSRAAVQALPVFWGRLLYRLFKAGLEKRRYLLFASPGAAKSLVSAAFFTERERPTETACTKGALFSAGPERSRISFAKEPFAEEVVFPVDGQNSLCYVISKVAKGLFFCAKSRGSGAAAAAHPPGRQARIKKSKHKRIYLEVRHAYKDYIVMH